MISISLFISSNDLIAQQYKLDRLSIFTTLQNEAEIPGVSAFLRIGPYEDFPGKNFGSVGKKYWHSDTITNVYQVISLGDSLNSASIFSTEVIYLLFDSEVDSLSLETYFEDLVRNEIFIPTVVNSVPNSEGELILMGNKIPYKPFYRLKIQILSDFRMILLISVLSLFSITALVLVIVIFVIKTRKKANDLQIARFKSLIYAPLCQLLFEFSLEELIEMDKAKILQFLPSKYIDQLLFKDVLIQEMISLNKNMKGDFKPKIKQIYRKLELDKRTFEKLSSKKWDIKATGISESNELDLFEAQEVIQTFVNSKNFYVRSQAIATLMNLSPDLKFDVLAAQTYPLSKWQQMTYLRIIRYKKSKGNLDVLFASSNISVRIFAIKVIEVLGLIDQLDLLCSHYSSVTKQEKIAMVKCFQSFGFVPNSSIFFQDLNSEDDELVIPIIRFFTTIGETGAVNILSKRLSMESSFPMIKAILEFIYKTEKSTYDQIISESFSEEFEAIHLHLTDPLLSHV